MTTPAKLQNVSFNYEPSDDTICENCGSAENVYYVDSDFGSLAVSLCIDCIDYDYQPEN